MSFVQTSGIITRQYDALHMSITSTVRECPLLHDRVSVRVGPMLERTSIDQYPTELVDFVEYPRYLVGY